MALDTSLSMSSSRPSLSSPSSPSSPRSRSSHLPSHRRFTRRFVSTLLVFFTIHSSPSLLFLNGDRSYHAAVEAVSCTYPNYNTVVQPGQNSVLTWQASSEDLVRYDSITATMFCMDINGDKGGIWRVATPLFKNRGLAPSGQHAFNVPFCGSLAKDVAIRIVALNQAQTVRDESSCYFAMNPVDPGPQPEPTKTTTTTTTKDPVPTSNPPVNPPPSTVNPITPQPTNPVQPTFLPPVSSSAGVLPSSSVTGSATLPSSSINPTARPLPALPPLPPLGSGDPAGTGIAGGGNGNGGGLDGGDGSGVGVGAVGPGDRNLTALFAAIGAAAAVVAAISVYVIRRRRQQSQRRGGRRGLLSGTEDGLGGSDGRPMKERLRIKGMLSKGSGKHERDFYLMKDGDDDDDYYDPSLHDVDIDHQEKGGKDPEKTATAAAVAKTDSFSEKRSSTSSTTGAGRGHDRISVGAAAAAGLAYPAGAATAPHLWRKSGSGAHIYADDDFTMSSMRSSFETSSVVREYWAASMAARTERQLEGFPQSRYSEGSIFGDHQYRSSPSFSSQSRKADILSLDTSSFDDESLIDGVGMNINKGTGAGGATKEGAVRRQYRNTMNSINTYLRRSMSMSLTSLQSGATSTDNDSWHHHPGFRSSINAEYLDHLNIKSLRSEQRQLQYYSHYYRQNPTMSTIDGVAYDGPLGACPDMGVGHRSRRSMSSLTSRRTSSAPSLTSTNDPFQTFDSNEILMDSEDPFSDEHALRTVRTARTVRGSTISSGSAMSGATASTTTTNKTKSTVRTRRPSLTPSQEAVLKSIPLPPPPPLMSVTGPLTTPSATESDRSNSTLLRAFPTPPVLSSAEPSPVSSVRTSATSIQLPPR